MNKMGGFSLLFFLFFTSLETSVEYVLQFDPIDFHVGTGGSAEQLRHVAVFVERVGRLDLNQLRGDTQKKPLNPNQYLYVMIETEAGLQG